MANFFENKLKPFEANKIHVVDYVNSDHYTRNVDKIKPRLLESLSATAHNSITMRFQADIYVFSENELKALLGIR